MKIFLWNNDKNEKLKKERGLSFEVIAQWEPIVSLDHPRYAHQRLLLFLYEEYIWVVPCVEQGNALFLKTLFPSRKYTKRWKRGEFL